MIPNNFTELIYIKKKEEKIKITTVEKITGWSRWKRINKFRHPEKLSVLEILTLCKIYEVTPEFMFSLILAEYNHKPYKH